MNYTLNGVDLTGVDLGVHLSQDLSWKYHIDFLLQQFTDRLNMLRRTVHFIKNIHQRRILYLSLVRSLLEHCSQVWAPTQVGLRVKLEAAQKRAIKWVYGVNPTVSWIEEIYHFNLTNISILPIHLHFLFNDLKLFYKIISGIINLDLPAYLFLKSPTDISYRTRANRDIIDLVDFTTVGCTAQPLSSAFRNSFFVRTYPKWNELPVEIRQSSSLDVFSIGLKTRLFSSLN
eukprot:sb/3469428/